MTLGCDYAWERPDPQALYGYGYRFACRYLSYDTTGKNLSAAEARALRTAGVSIVLNWEYAPDAALRGFIQGHDDAVAAAAQRAAVGAPNAVPVYFSVDFNATPAQMPEVLSYLAGCVSVLGYDGVGVYGSLAVVQAAFNANVCKWLWQTYAWSNGVWDSRAHIRQTRNGVPFAGVSIDLDESTTVDYGQWSSGGSTVTTPITAQDPDFEALIWRVEAMAGMLDTVEAGPRAGEAMGLVVAVRDIKSMVANTNAAVSALQSAVNALAAQIGGLTAKSGSLSGTASVSGTLTVGP